jgi:hypothetical protein
MASNFKCRFCGKSFAKEKTLAVHVCEKKRRFLSKDEKHVRYGLLTYQRFYQLTQSSAKVKTFEEFADSPYYNAFVKFGSFLSNTVPIYPERFIDYVVKSGVKLDHWCRDELYDKYVAELVKIEPADGAVQRSITTMINWGTDQGSPWEHYFKYVSLNRATRDIREGYVSPWIVLNCTSGREMLQRMTNEQLEIISGTIDPAFWRKQFKLKPADVLLAKAVIKEARIP